MMYYDYIIIGQGICGTWLSYYLIEAGKSIIVFDDASEQSSSRVASGLINPVTGRRVVTTWMADELLSFVWNEYSAISKKLNAQFIQQKDIIVFPSAPDLMQAFDKRLQQGNGYILQPSTSKEELHNYFNFPFGAMRITPAYLINVNDLISKYRQYLKTKNAFNEETFNEDVLSVSKGNISYKNIRAEKIIYCNGVQSAQSKYWKNLPFVRNKGQALIAEIHGLDKNYTYKFGNLSFTTWLNNLWWIGSSNELNFADEQPTEVFYHNTLKALRSILKIDFTIKEHLSSVRPAAVERRPFVGVHPLHNQLSILNGMGSKGCSLAPWFANELAAHLINKKTINVLADVSRYANVLKRE